MAEQPGRQFRFRFWNNPAPQAQRPPAPAQPTFPAQRAPFWPFAPRMQLQTRMPRPLAPSPPVSPVQPAVSRVSQPQSVSPIAASPTTSQPPSLAQPMPAVTETLPKEETKRIEKTEEKRDEPTKVTSQAMEVGSSNSSPDVAAALDIPIMRDKFEARAEATQDEKPITDSERKIEAAEEEKHESESKTTAEAVEDGKWKSEAEMKPEPVKDENPKTEADTKSEGTEDEKPNEKESESIKDEKLETKQEAIEIEFNGKSEATEVEKLKTKREAIENESETEGEATEDEKLETKREAIEDESETEAEATEDEKLETKREAIKDESKTEAETKLEPTQDEKLITEPKASATEMEEVRTDGEPTLSKDEKIMDMETSSSAEPGLKTQQPTEVVNVGTEQTAIDPKDITSSDADGTPTETVAPPDSNVTTANGETGKSDPTLQAASHEFTKEDASMVTDDKVAGHVKQTGDEHLSSRMLLTSGRGGVSMRAGHNGANQEGAVLLLRGNNLNKDAVVIVINSDTEGSSEGRADQYMNRTKHLPTFINSNWQAINNSIVFKCSYRERNPGVHLVMYGNPIDPVSPKNTWKIFEAHKDGIGNKPSSKLYA